MLFEMYGQVAQFFPPQDEKTKHFFLSFSIDFHA